MLSGNVPNANNKHAKYNTMHEFMMMEEVAVMLLLVAESMMSLIKNPAIGKNNKVFNMSCNLND